MENKLPGIHRGFSLVELAVAIVIMGIMASVMVISPSVSKQSAKHEAERLQEYIYRQMQKADRIHKSFLLDIGKDSHTGKYFVMTNWGSAETKDPDDYKITNGCSYETNFDNKNNNYSPYTRRFPNGGYIRIVDADGEDYFVILAALNEGRIRISETR